MPSEQEIAFAHLDNASVVNAYNASNKSVIFLDLNGTIVVKEPPGKYLKREILGTSGHKAPQEVSAEIICAQETSYLGQLINAFVADL